MKETGIKDMDWEYSRETYSDDCTAQERFNRTEEILDFANMVFSVAYGGTDFGWLLPKAYAPQRSGLPIHHMIRSRGRGRIRALIDLYPLDLQLRGRPDRIRAVYVGTVAVHPNDTGRGYMTALMQRAVADARRQGCALMILDARATGISISGLSVRGSDTIFISRRIISNIVMRSCA